MPRREGEVFFFGTAMAPGLFHSNKKGDVHKGSAHSIPLPGAQARE
jgi:hypothetical protein